MSPKMAACDPCRSSKVACDHAKPICGRCRQKNKSGSCTYRLRPFKRQSTSTGPHTRHRRTPEEEVSPTRCMTTDSEHLSVSSAPESDHQVENPSQHYPNPGYLGHSSHVTIFDHLSPTVDAHNSDAGRNFSHHSTGTSVVSVSGQYNLRGRNLIEEIMRNVSITSCARLVEAWVKKGINLAIAGNFTLRCVRIVEGLSRKLRHGSQDANTISAELFRESNRPLSLQHLSSIEDFCTLFCQDKARWETLGLFFTAVSRSTIDIVRFDDLFSTQQQRQKLRALATRFSDCCLDFAMTLDCLNDLQLFLQYENFINHSMVNGDMSYPSWSSLGNVISSLYALGYHDQARNNEACPPFLQNLRDATFASTYSADKNVSIFLGRPPRMHHKYCAFDFLKSVEDAASGTANSTVPAYFGWSTNLPFDYKADSWWSVTCALQKEEILELFREKNAIEKSRKASCIKADLERMWRTLPPRFRLEGRLITSADSPIDRDFLASARLNYLHVFFLLYLSQCERLNEPDSELLSVSAEILSLIVETAILKEHLVNSGTGLVWRTAYYGLPAAGILCLALLNKSRPMRGIGLSILKVFQDLSVLVAEIETGGLVDPSDPNYALLSKAMSTIKTILDRAVLGQNDREPTSPTPRNVQSRPTEPLFDEQWPSWANFNSWDFEMEFWTNLAGHPDLSTNGYAMPDLSQPGDFSNFNPSRNS